MTEGTCRQRGLLWHLTSASSSKILTSSLRSASQVTAVRSRASSTTQRRQDHDGGMSQRVKDAPERKVAFRASVKRMPSRHSIGHASNRSIGTAGARILCGCHRDHSRHCPQHGHVRSARWVAARRYADGLTPTIAVN